jgi:hypothetical protein
MRAPFKGRSCCYFKTDEAFSENLKWWFLKCPQTKLGNMDNCKSGANRCRWSRKSSSSCFAFMGGTSGKCTNYDQTPSDEAILEYRGRQWCQEDGVWLERVLVRFRDGVGFRHHYMVY